MQKKTYKLLQKQYGIGEEIYKLSHKIEEELQTKFNYIDSISQYNQYKVLKAFQDNNISEAHFVPTTGYGYGDLGRDTLEKVYADAFKSEDALIRHNLISGTHALTLCLFSILKQGDTLVSVAGKPYDTFEEVIGIRGENKGSLKEMGVKYKQVDLTEENRVDYAGLKSTITNKTKAAFIQRSRGYDWRPSLTVEEISQIIKLIKSINPNTICVVDNCYGEFVEIIEPSEIGADMMAGSLIKNPGGGLAPTGGYIVGKSELIKLASYRLTSPGIGKDAGASLGINRHLYQGFFMAPHVVAQSLKTATFCGAVFNEIGFEVSPNPDEYRTDIIQAIKFNNPDLVINFCQGIQKAAPIDSFVEPQPWEMPGYNSKVIMAAGAFIQGASIELSADAPIKPPYLAYMQGGLSWEHGKIAIMIAVQHMINKGLIIK